MCADPKLIPSFPLAGMRGRVLVRTLALDPALDLDLTPTLMRMRRRRRRLRLLPLPLSGPRLRLARAMVRLRPSSKLPFHSRRLLLTLKLSWSG